MLFSFLLLRKKKKHGGHIQQKYSTSCIVYFFKSGQAGERTLDLLVFVLFLFCKQRLGPLGYCPRSLNCILCVNLELIFAISKVVNLSEIVVFSIYWAGYAKLR